jgi:hypothetical protein
MTFTIPIAIGSDTRVSSIWLLIVNGKNEMTRMALKW